ncbi:MAG: universal stress protein [Alphaproteobacteria bacterium]|nr:universal stress protein [Alphaproteobacteria bacterium]
MFKDILVPLDLNSEKAGQRTLPVAAELCRTFGARLHVLNVVPDFGLAMVGQYFPEGYEDKMAAQADEHLHALVKEAVPDDIQVQCIIADGNIYHEIVETAEKVNADLIVMRSHRPELRDYLIGPNAEKVARHADCSVMIIRGEGH